MGKKFSRKHIKKASSKPQFECTWNQLLIEALEKPGAIHSCFSQFHEYSIGNAMLAHYQCSSREIEFGPIATYKKWKEQNRQVKKGQKAIWLWMPQVGKREEEVTNKDTGKKETQEIPFTYFKLKNFWFVVSQTEGEPLKMPEPKEWDYKTALNQLKIEEVSFSHPSGNCQGFALPGRRIAVNPVAAMPLKTAVHEMAHVLLGHCEEGQQSDDETTPRSLREIQAESVAMIVCDALGDKESAKYSRGYIQHWNKEKLTAIDETNVRKIFNVADEILKAGQGKTKDPKPTKPKKTNN